MGQELAPGVQMKKQTADRTEKERETRESSSRTWRLVGGGQQKDSKQGSKVSGG